MIFIKDELLHKLVIYKRWEQNYISLLHRMMTHISWFKESTERRKTRIVKEIEENADLHKFVLNKSMTTQEYCVKYDFVAPLMEKLPMKLKIVINYLKNQSYTLTKIFIMRQDIK